MKCGAADFTLNMMSEENSARTTPGAGADICERGCGSDMQSAQHEAAAKTACIPHSDSGIVVSPQTPLDQETFPGALSTQQRLATSQESPSDITVTPQSPEREAHVAFGSQNDTVENDSGRSVSTAEQNPWSESGLKRSLDSLEKRNTSEPSVSLNQRSPVSQRSPVNRKSPSKSPRSSTHHVTDAGDHHLQHFPGAGDDDPLHESKSETSRSAQGKVPDTQAQKPPPASSPTPLRMKVSPRSSQHHRRSFGDGDTSGTATPSPRRWGEFGSRSARSPRPHKQLSLSKVPASFTYETKYVVLQFLQQATNEQNFMSLSNSSQSQSSASESESRRRVHTSAQKLRAQWQNSRSASQPSSPKRTRHPLAKTKGNRSSPNLKDARFFKEDLPSSSPARLLRSQTLTRPATGARSSTRLDIGFVRSVSDYTEPSENGDADDELDTSFDSSQNGSVVSHSLKDRMASVRTSRLPTVRSESEAMTEYQYAASNTSDVTLTEETQEIAVEDEAVSLDMIQIEDTPLSPLDAFNRVHLYLAQMNEHSQGLAPSGQLSVVEDSLFTPDTTLQDQDEMDSPPFNRTTVPDSDPYVTGEFQPATTEADIDEDGDDRPDFYQSSGSDNQPVDTEEGAVGGGDGDVDDGDDVADGDDDNEAGLGGGNRNKLRLDLPPLETNSDPPLLTDAVLSLQQELEEELSSFESEFEEAMQNLQSDSSLGHSRSVTPVTLEVARLLTEIGDSAQRRYFSNLEMAVGRLLISSCGSLFTYENFRHAFMTILRDDNMEGWRQVSILLLYSQHVALHMAHLGRRGVHRIVDYTVRLLADTAADFILEQGGWAAISSIGQHSSSSSEIGPTCPIDSSSSVLLHSSGVDPADLTNLPGPDTFQLPPPVTGEPFVTDGQSLPSSERGGNPSSQQGVAGAMMIPVCPDMDPLESTPGQGDSACFPGQQINHDLVGGASDAVRNLSKDEGMPTESVTPGGQDNGAESTGVIVPANTGVTDPDSSGLLGPENTGAVDAENTDSPDCPKKPEEGEGAGPDITDGGTVHNNPEAAVPEPEPAEGNSSVLSVVQNLVTNPRRAVGYAVSVGIMAVGAALMLGINRS